MGKKEKSMSKIDEIILEEYGVDTAELVKEYGDIIDSKVVDGHMETVEALAAYIVASSEQGDATGYMGAMIMLFAVGYKAGKNA